LEAHLPAFERAAENGGTLEPGKMSDLMADFGRRTGREGLAFGGRGCMGWYEGR
jgi:hypothetical protein